MPTGKILIVDDDEDIRQLVGTSLSNRGYEVISASSGDEGLAMAVSGQPDMIVLDVEMPGMDGIQTCQEIRKHLMVPVLFLSVRSEETDVVLGLGVGADNYLTKPFRIPELIAHVDAAMRRKLRYSQAVRTDQAMRVKDLTLDLSAH